MAYRQVILANGEIHHMINRGVEQVSTFLDKRDYSRFLETCTYYQKVNPPVRFSFKKRVPKKRLLNLGKQKNLIEIICYCLMPNHFHFLLKQTEDDGISSFVSKVTNSYTRYFNIRHRRKGHLFQGPFKAVRIAADEQLIHVSRYIHLNPVVDYLVEDPKDYLFSSYQEYLSGGLNGGVVKKNRSYLILIL